MGVLEYKMPNIKTTNMKVILKNKENNILKIKRKIDYEKNMLLYMIKLYCRYNHKEYHKNYNKTFGSKNICKECEEVLKIFAKNVKKFIIMLAKELQNADSFLQKHFAVHALLIAIKKI